MDVILFGPPGAGKGTHAGAVSAAAGIVHVSTGDIFRRHLREGTELGALAKTYMDAGDLVPDRVVVDIVASRLVEDDARAGALFDGFPRTIPQAELLAQWLVDHDRDIDLVLNLQVPDAVIVRRLSGRRTCLACGASYHVDHAPPSTAGECDRCGGEVVQRKDDSEKTILARLETYHAQTAPVLDWFRSRGAVADIDATGDIGIVKAAVLAALPH